MYAANGSLPLDGRSLLHHTIALLRVNGLFAQMTSDTFAKKYRALNLIIEKMNAVSTKFFSSSLRLNLQCALGSCMSIESNCVPRYHQYLHHIRDKPA